VESRLAPSAASYFRGRLCSVSQSGYGHTVRAGDLDVKGDLGSPGKRETCTRNLPQLSPAGVGANRTMHTLETAPNPQEPSRVLSFHLRLVTLTGRPGNLLLEPVGYLISVPKMFHVKHRPTCKAWGLAEQGRRARPFACPHPPRCVKSASGRPWAVRHGAAVASVRRATRRLPDSRAVTSATLTLRRRPDFRAGDPIPSPDLRGPARR